MVTKYNELIVWQKSLTLVVSVYDLTKLLPKSESFGITSQIQRSAVSIPSNIAEGFRRRSNKEFTRFLNIAMGSCSELETQLEIIKQVYPSIVVSNHLSMTDEVGRMLNKLRSSLSTQ